MKDTIKDIFYSLGAELCGVASIDRFIDAPKGFHPTDLYKECKSVIVFGKVLPKGLYQVSPRLIYTHGFEMTRIENDRIGYLASLEVEKQGATAVPLPCDSPYEYWDDDNQRGCGLLSMRHAAMLAGLGSMGKNTLILNSVYGNRFFIGAVLTDLALKSDPLSESVCLTGCTLCLDNCPTGALDGITVDQKKCRPYTYATNEKGYDITNCNTCRVICPVGQGK